MLKPKRFFMYFCAAKQYRWQMRKKIQYGKKDYILHFWIVVAVLFVVKCLFPSVTHTLVADSAASAEAEAPLDTVTSHSLYVDSVMAFSYRLPRDLTVNPQGKSHRILSVRSFKTAFPDLNEVQLATADKLGIAPVQNREEADKFDHSKLVYAGNSPFYHVRRLDHSIPYLVPRAQLLLNDIARTFMDSLMVKKIKPSMIIVTSMTRSEEDVAQLRKRNANATDRSCHCRGTAFDISYSKYHPVQDPDAAPVRQTSDDTLKWVLSEVLRDKRELGLCYVKYEVHQGCFHITAR